MHYIPNTENDISSMIHEIGLTSTNELFKAIPHIMKRPLRIPDPVSEVELIAHMKELSEKNAHIDETPSFLGGGAYHHFIPSVVPNILSRSEFYTAYTPYQPEISQGTLQAIFEFQTFISMLTGMEVANASMYDGASSTAEAVLMATRSTKRSKAIVSKGVHPHYISTIQTYLSGRSNTLDLVDFNVNGVTDITALEKKIDDSTACVVVQYPNFFGIIENLGAIENLAHKHGALFVVTFSEAISYGLLKPPGYFNADIVAGEGQSLGLPPGFGGPYLGLLATSSKLLRTMPGRIVGETTDRNGKRSYVLTLSAREQHIRREKATSNICSNEGLCALAATIYLSVLGKHGLREIALLNHQKTEYCKKLLTSINGTSLKFKNATFNEFVLSIKKDPEEMVNHFASQGMLIGIPLGQFFNALSDSILITVTEMNTKKQIEKLYNGIKSYLK